DQPCYTDCRRVQCKDTVRGARDNSFLNHFYEHLRQNTLPVQLCFPMQRARQLDLLCQWDLFDRAWVAAFMLEKDQLCLRA
ncbi:MAG: deoxynucleoside kinase, partial [Pseudomonadota bacterium]|nr:deoxynucleoside kinase [Pseudomonadota bacterium]